jgi:hypothetical protein
MNCGKVSSLAVLVVAAVMLAQRADPSDRIVPAPSTHVAVHWNAGSVGLRTRSYRGSDLSVCGNLAYRPEHGAKPTEADCRDAALDSTI